MIRNNITLKAGLAGIMLLLCARAEAQFKAGSSFHVLADTPLIIDSLTLQPVTTAADLSNTTLTVSHIPIPPAGSNSGSIARVYEFDPAINFRGIPGLRYLNSELNGNAASSLSFVYDNGNSNFTASSVITTNNTNNYVVATTGSNTVTLKRVTAMNTNVPLPVHLLSFNAKAEGSRTRIEWATASEYNCDHFEVERSTDSRSFQFLLSENAAGNSSAVQEYTTYDEQPLKGWNYYRLKQVDIDGAFTWSPVVAVFFGSGDGAYVSVYPNPVQNRLSIAMNSKEDQQTTLLLMDAAGRSLKSQKLQLVKGDNTFSLDMDELAAGIYLLRIGTTFQTKLVKQK